MGEKSVKRVLHFIFNISMVILVWASVEPLVQELMARLDILDDNSPAMRVMIFVVGSMILAYSVRADRLLVL